MKLNETKKERNKKMKKKILAALTAGILPSDRKCLCGRYRGER